MMKKLSLFIAGLCLLLCTAGVVVAASVVGPSRAEAVPATGLITGSISVATGQPGGDVCTYAIAVSGQPGSWVATGARYVSAAAAGGSYELSVPVGTYAVRFDPSCGGTISSSYAAQYYLDQLDLENANAVTVSAISPATGTDAALAPGFSVSGAVSAPGAPGATADVCVSADDRAGHAVDSARTSTDGRFTIGNLPTGHYWVYFDPTCGGAQVSAYAPQYYPGHVLPTAGSQVQVAANVSAIDAQLVAGSSISGTVTAPGAADNAGICAYAIGVGGHTAGRTVTNIAGVYGITNLGAGSYSLRFDPTCGGSQTSYFSSQNYQNTVTLAAGQHVQGINGTMALRYGPELSITVASLPAGTLHLPYSETLSINGPSTEPTDYAWHVTGLPPGLYPEPSSLSEEIVGRPQVVGSFSVTTTATAAGSVPPLVARRTFRLLIEPASPTVSISLTTGQVSGHRLEVRLHCTEAACSGRASVVSARGAVLGAGPYSMARGASTTVELKMTAAGPRAFAKARAHPVEEKLVVSVRRGHAVEDMVRFS